LLKRCISANGLTDRWRLIPACAATADGHVLLLADRFAESRVSHEAQGAIEVASRDVFPFLEAADFVKMDIEGSEWEILQDPRFLGIAARVIVIEYHPQGCPGPVPREAAQVALRRLGCVVQDIAVPHAPPGVGMLWAWRHAPSDR
jgi:hypothetical protein